MPRHADPELEQRILDAASRLWSRGGPKTLTMRAVAKLAGTTTPTVYERYRDRDDILLALRVQTRNRLYAALCRTRTLRDACRCYLEFAVEHPHAYEVLFDGVGKPPSLYEPWPSFNLFRDRLAQLLGGASQDHNRLMLALWSLMHGTVMLVIRGGFEGALRTQTIFSCTDAFDEVVASARRKGFLNSGPRWPSTLVLGEAKKSRVIYERTSRTKARTSVKSAKKPPRRG